MADQIVYRIIPQLTDQQIERFWDKVTIGTDAECWPWGGHTYHNGYGQISINSHQYRSHRVAFFLTFGRQPIADCLHQCDNPPCCNPSHLWEGTVQDNMSDRDRKGRNASGDRNGSRTHPERLARGTHSSVYLHPEIIRRGEEGTNTKLTETEVFEIRHQYIGGATRATLALEFGISESGVAHIIYARNWKHLNLISLKQKTRCK